MMNNSKALHPTQGEKGKDDLLLSQPCGERPSDYSVPEAANTAALADLLARVEAAEGPDRYVDCWLACALDGFFPVPKQWPVRADPELVMVWRVDFCCYRDGGLSSPGHGGDQMVPEYTSSLDAALALVERVLPGWTANISTFDEHAGYGDTQDYRLPYACVAGEPYQTQPGWGEAPECERPVHDARAKTPALALLAAMLKAKIAKGSEG